MPERRSSPPQRNTAGCKVKYLIWDRDGKYPGMFDVILADAGIKMVLSGIRVPRMNDKTGAPVLRSLTAYDH
jgi:hypothetical protein